MNYEKHPLIGVITARASESEQHQLLSGILSQAEMYGAETAVFSNIYNFDEYYADVEVENKIYELITSQRLDALILTAESILNPWLQQFIYQNIVSREISVPVIVTGAEIPGFTCVNNSVTDDFADIAAHLADVHGFTDIHILTGPEDVPTSHERAEGVRRALAERDIPFPDENIIYGDFWMPSGEKLADEYISGKRKMPQAVIFGNDYMAYGLLDRFFEKDIPVPDALTVVGYEHIGDRIYHSPVLTTYQRNRYAVGARAVDLIMKELTGNDVELTSLGGEMVCGDTCPCGIDRRYLGAELNSIRKVQYYNELNICGNFEQQMTVCRSMPEYIRGLQDYVHLLRDVRGVYLCLYEDWCSSNSKADLNVSSNDKSMTCYRVISPVDVDAAPEFFTRSQLFPDKLPGADNRHFLYFVPVFSAGRELGHFIFQYLAPDCYDSIMRDWLKIAVNALQVLRMKNDIRALLECTNLSESHDSVTGLYNRSGLVTELEMSLNTASASDSLMVILVRAGILSDDYRIDDKRISVRIDVEMAESLKKVSSDKKQFCAKISDKLFAFAVVGNVTDDYCSAVRDKIDVLISHSPVYCEHCGFNTALYVSGIYPSSGADPEKILSALSEDILKKRQLLAVTLRSLQYRRYSELRNAVYRSPGKDWDAQQTCREFQLSYGHFRAAYKEMFSISFHKDVIQGRIALAKYLLLTTSMSLAAIADKCGYDDDKYFMRQFRQLAGVTPNQYRDMSFIS